MSKLLKRRVVGDPILRKKARHLTKLEISRDETKQLIANMSHTLKEKKYGIAIAAPQVGEPVAIVVVDLKKTPTRLDTEEYKAVLINPVITKYIGKTKPMRDGCISVGAEDDPLYGWSERYEEVEVEWVDELRKHHQEKFEGLLAHVMQHEIDHLNGILFIDRVKDPKTYIHASEYLKIIDTKK